MKTCRILQPLYQFSPASPTETLIICSFDQPPCCSYRTESRGRKRKDGNPLLDLSQRGPYNDAAETRMLGMVRRGKQDDQGDGSTDK